MGRPVRKKYFKDPINVVCYINLPIIGLQRLPVHKQVGNKSFSVEYSGLYFTGILVEKEPADLLAGEMIIKGRNNVDGIVYPIEKLTQNRVYFNKEIAKWYVIQEMPEDIATKVEIETLSNPFEEIILIPGPLDLKVPEVDGFHALSHTFDVAAPDISVGMVSLYEEDSPGSLQIKLSHGNDELEIVEMSKANGILSLVAIGHNIKEERDNINVDVTGGKVGPGGMRVNEIIFEDSGNPVTWKKSVSGISTPSRVFGITPDSEPTGMLKVVGGFYGKLYSSKTTFSNPDVVETVYSDTVVMPGEPWKKLDDTNSIWKLNKNWTDQGDGWYKLDFNTSPGVYYVSYCDTDTVGQNVGWMIDLDIPENKGVNLYIQSPDGNTSVGRTIAGPFKGTIYSLSASTTTTMGNRLSIGLQGGCSVNINSISLSYESSMLTYCFGTSVSDTSYQNKFIGNPYNWSPAPNTMSMVAFDAEKYIPPEPEPEDND